jgi:plasmid maintenance system antidote protein VapI
MSAKFWLGLQDDYDLEEQQNSKVKELANIKQVNAA